MEGPLPDHMWKSYIGSLGDIGPTLRVDRVANDGEGVVAAVRVQARVEDPEGVKPYLILDASLDRLTGRFSFCVRDDRRHRGSSSGSFDGRGQGNDLAIKAIIRHLGERLEAEGHADASKLILETLERGGGTGHVTFRRELAPRLVAAYEACKGIEKLAPGEWYLAGEIPPAGWLTVHLFRTADDGSGQGRIDSASGIVVELTKGPSGWSGTPRAWDLGPSYSEQYQGRLGKIPADLADEMRRYITPEFGRETDAKVEMPVWTRPLDSLAACLERIKDQRHAFDAMQHIEAIEGILDRRAELEFNVDVMVAAEGGRHRPAHEQRRWAGIIAGLSEYCACCGVSKIKPLNPRPFVPDEGKRFTLRPGQAAILSPDAGGERQAPVQVRIFEARDGVNALEIMLRPYSEMLLTAWFAPETHDIAKLREALKKLGGPIPGTTEGQTLMHIVAAETDGAVTFVPDQAFTFVLQ